MLFFIRRTYNLAVTAIVPKIGSKRAVAYIVTGYRCNNAMMLEQKKEFE